MWSRDRRLIEGVLIVGDAKEEAEAEEEEAQAQDEEDGEEEEGA